MIEIIDKTEIYRAYDIKKYVERYLKEIPMEDLKGISKINIYDDSPSHFPKDKAGGYYPNSTGQGAGIDIFLHQTLGYRIYISKRGVLKKVKNRIFLMLFGKLFVANTLFHEVGHHRSESIGSRTEEESEEDAKNYADGLLGEIYPCIYRNYDIFNRLYKKIYRKRIEQAKEIEANITVYNPNYFDYMGKMYLNKNEYEKAITEFDHLIVLEPTYINAYVNRGLAKAKLGRNQEAIDDFTLAISSNPQDYIAYYNRGLCYHCLNEWDEAIADYTQAIELEYPYPDVYVNRSSCYEALKK